MSTATSILKQSDTIPALPSFALGGWVKGHLDGKTVFDAVYGRPVVNVSSDGLDFAEMLGYARTKGFSNLQKLSFHERALRLKAIAQHLLSKKEVFYDLSFMTGATRNDSWVDIDGGIGTLLSYSSMARREMPSDTFLVEGNALALSRDGSFYGHHLLTSKEGVALHINAFNFPCWGMLEKLAPNLIAGVPAIVKPATQTAFVTQAVVEEIMATGLLPEGSLQLISGSVGDIFEHLDEQDTVTFTGSAYTGKKLKSHPNIIDKAIPFNMEADSLNCSILGESVATDSEEFELFIREVSSEMTTKSGQRCTAIRRVIVPRGLTEAVQEALAKVLNNVIMGDPTKDNVQMGPLVGKDQKDEVRDCITRLSRSCEIVYGEDDFRLEGGDKEKGGFLPATLLYCDQPLSAAEPHSIEAFGPVSTLLPYDSLDEAVELAKLGKGSLVGSVISNDTAETRRLVLGSANHHGRLLVLNRHNAKSSTGHGSPLPNLIHGGPGRAGGGEELGGIRAIKHYMQRTALQADPTTLMAITRQYIPGAETTSDRIHPFRKTFDELNIGESLITHRRTVTEADIVNFANVTGDYFYAHVDEVAAPDSLFGKRVAHGYFLVSAAAGLFVDPAPGPVLANYGLENLRFIEPVGIGDTIQAKLTVKTKTRKEKREDEKTPAGVVEWDVQLSNQENVLVATYSILTLVERADD